MHHLPQVLVIDDFFGRALPGSYHRDRVGLCAKFKLWDRTVGGIENESAIADPCAEAVFLRGQTPDPAHVGDVIRNDLHACVEAVTAGWHDAIGQSRPWSMILLDLCFYTGVVTDRSNRRAPGMPEPNPADDDPRGYFGIEILRAIQQKVPDIPVVILSSKSREEVSREFSIHGAAGFLARDAEDSPALLREYLERHALMPDATGTIVGASKGLLLALRAARRAAGAKGSVLLRGEPGTGKELFARYIHEHSPRKHRVFESRSLAAVPSTLAESELFGHVKGSFTGAKADRHGAFETADKGTLFLDEVGDAAPDLQAKLLRALELGEIQPVGQDRMTKVDTRVISATNVDIEGRAARGSGFRQDLLGRLRQGGTIWLPPLRERKEDIPLLAEQFTRLAEKAHGRALPRVILPETLAELASREWPGNVRDLRNCIWQAVMDFPDVEFMAPSHLKDEDGTRSTSMVAPPAGLPVTTATTPGIGLPALRAVLAGYEPSVANIQEWVGRLPELQEDYARCIARLIGAAVRATKRVTAKNPAGEVQIHPAMKFLTGDSSLTASKAADLIKRLLSIVPADRLGPITDDEDVKTALLIAQRLRPSSAKK